MDVYTIVPGWALDEAYKDCKAWAERTGRDFEYVKGGDRIDRAYKMLDTYGDKLSQKWEEYQTTNKSCLCQDYQNRQDFCKHILARFILLKAQQKVNDLGDFQTKKHPRMKAQLEYDGNGR